MPLFRSRIYTSARFMLLLVGCALLGPTCVGEARAQAHRARITIVSLAPARVRVDLQLAVATNALSFRNTYGGVLGLGDRIERLEATNGARSIQVKKLAPGEYQAETKFTLLSYEVNLTEPAQPAQLSHVSWLNSDQGLLMLADLLPRLADPGSVASIKLDVPSGWSVGSNVPGKNPEYLTTDPDKGVFLVGPSVREKSRRIGVTDFTFITSGKWPVSDGDVLKIAEKLIMEYTNLTGHVLQSKTVLMSIEFPGEAGPEHWTAETRGNAVVLLLGTQARRKRVLAKLGVILSHEIFHLWVPNALALEGDYDWFFEGFTLYQALRMALHLKFISFDTFLETIARVYNSYLSSSDHDRLSLIQASERRWTTASSLVYDKGMLAAFVYDLELRRATDCQASLDDIYRQLFRQHGTGQGSANETIIGLLSKPAALNSFGHDYVEGTGRINLQPALTSYGIQLRPAGPRAQATKLELVNNLSNTQRKALRCLGYRG
ncbi:MAG: hypothetical protein H7Z16_08150 [Pyrinomonadaceae bacterium]|nr:hypothetical protein [Pyrinomonadaceae bacterium]